MKRMCNVFDFDVHAKTHRKNVIFIMRSPIIDSFHKTQWLEPLLITPQSRRKYSFLQNSQNVQKVQTEFSSHGTHKIEMDSFFHNFKRFNYKSVSPCFSDSHLPPLLLSLLLYNKISINFCQSFHFSLCFIRNLDLPLTLKNNVLRVRVLMFTTDLVCASLCR